MATDANLYLVPEGTPVTDTNSANNTAVNLLPGGTPLRRAKPSRPSPSFTTGLLAMMRRSGSSIAAGFRGPNG